MPPKTQIPHGFSLVEAVIAILIVSLVGLGLNSLFRNATSMQRFSGQHIDRDLLRMQLSQNIDCEATLPPATLTSCKSGSGLYVTLFGSEKKVLADAAGNTKVGDFTLRAHCHASGLDVRVASFKVGAKVTPTDLDFGSKSVDVFRQEPVSTLLLNWNHPKSKLFPDSNTAPCANVFSATSKQCAPDEVVAGFNPNGSLICKKVTPLVTLPSCPAGHYLGGIAGGAPECRPLPKFSCYSAPLGNGSFCAPGYTATGCWQRTNSILFKPNLKDFDINWLGNGCTTDGEEAAAGIEVAAICCKIVP